MKLKHVQHSHYPFYQNIGNVHKSLANGIYLCILKMQRTDQDDVDDDDDDEDDDEDDDDDDEAAAVLLSFIDNNF